MDFALDCTDLFTVVETPKMPYTDRLNWWKRGYWVDRNLKCTPVALMEDAHLLSVYKLIKTSAEERRRNLVRAYISYPEPQGEMAQICYDEEFAWAMNLDTEDILYTHPFIPHLLEDVVRRGRHADWLKQFDLDAEGVEAFLDSLRATYY